MIAAVVPPVMPVTIPVVGVTVAFPTAPLVQVPPAGELISVMFALTHTVDGPVIAEGSALTVNTVRAAHPVTGRA